MITTSVLVTDGGQGSSRSALATVRALGVEGFSTTVTTSFGSEMAARSRFAAAHVAVPPAEETTAYRSAIRDLMRTRGITTVFATSDDALIALDPIAAEFVDKNLLHKRLEDAGIPTAPTQVFETTEELLSAQIDGPVVVKPVTGSTPAVRFAPDSDPALLDPFDGALVVQPFLTGTMESVSGVIWDGRLVAAVHQRYRRTWPVECGTASYATTVHPDEQREESLTSLLRDHSGIFQAQYLAGSLIDINPRPYGSMPLALRAGLNLPALVCEYNSSDGASSLHTLRPTVGVNYRWIEGDIRNLLTSVRGGSITTVAAIAALRPRRNTAHSIFAMNDLRPMASRAATIARSAREIRNP